MEGTAADYEFLRWERLSRDFENLGLSKRYLELLEANPSWDLPYHGNPHQMAVAILAVRGGYSHALRREEIQALALSAIFHDYGYSLEDSEPLNISVAIEIAREFVRELNPELEERVAGLIGETEIPRSSPRSLAAAVLQDADLLMVAQPDAEVFVAGLESERPGTVADPRFPGAAALHTDWARRIYATAIELQDSGCSIEDPRQALMVGNTQHLQTLSSRGFLVDSSMAEGLERLWAAGFETLASCGGDSNSISPGWTTPMRGYIAFQNPSEEQRRRIEVAARGIGSEPERYDNLGRAVMVVRFDSERASLLFLHLLQG